MQLECEIRSDIMVIRVGEARIDAAVAIQFKDRMRELTTDAPARVVLDMEEVAFLDSSGLGAVVAAMKQLGPNRKLELAALSPAVDKVFRLTRMDSVFRIHCDAGTALNGLPHAS